MDLHRLIDSIAEMHLKFTSAGVICYMLILTPTANFAVDPDQTVHRRAIRFGSTLFDTKTAYGSLWQGNATYAYVNGQYHRTDKNLGPGSDCSYEIWVNIDCFKDVFQ